jgi:hypothetical protein
MLIASRLAHTNARAHMYIHPYTSHSLLNPRKKGTNKGFLSFLGQPTKAKDLFACRHEIARSWTNRSFESTVIIFEIWLSHLCNRARRTMILIITISLHVRVCDLHLIGSARPFVFFIFNQNIETDTHRVVLSNQKWMMSPIWIESLVWTNTHTAVWSLDACM